MRRAFVGTAVRTIAAGAIVAAVAQPLLTAQAAIALPSQAASSVATTVGAAVAPTTTFELRARTVSRLNTLRPDNISTRCVLAGTQAKVCRVVLTARVNGERATIGVGVTRLDGSRARIIRVPIYLNRHGLTLAARPHGVNATARGEARALSTNTWLQGSDKTRIVSTPG